MSSNLFWDLQQALKLGLAVTTDVWNYPIGDWVSSVHAADINGDGDMEVLLASRNCNIYVLTRRGTLEGKYRPSNGWVRAIRGNDDAGTTDKTPIVVGSRDNKVQVLNKNGEVLWSYQTNGEVCDIRICDMNHDGKSEILVACEDSCIHALSGETGEVFWKYDTLSTVYTVDVNDIDLDGEIEILATASDMQLYVLDSRGQLKWKYDTKSESALIFTTDIDGDGQVEILLASNTRGLSALTPLRQEKWHFPFDKRFLSITVADLDKDGQLEIIAATEDKRLYFFDNQGQLLWIHTLNNQVFSLCAADLDHDGAVEVLIGTEDSIHVLHVDLMRGLRENILASHKLLGKPQSTKLALSSSEIALLRDITNEWSLDKQLLTLANAKQHRQSGDTLQALSMLTMLRQQRVQVLWHKEIGHVRAVYAGDVNNDGRLEIVAGTDEGAICVFDADGGKLWSNPHDDCVWTVYVGDIDLDGTFEIVAGSASGLLSVFNQAGEVKWQSHLGEQVESVYINEMQGLGYAEMVVGLRGNQGGQIQIYDNHFSSVIEPITTPYGIKVVGLHDLNDDGMADIVAVGDDDSVYAYTRDGNLLWSYRIGDGAGDLARGLSLRDIDADGGIEIVVGSEDRNVHILDRAGHLKWCYYTPHRVLSVNTRDVDQDGAVEVFLGTDDGYVYFLSKTGDLLWKYRVGSRVRGVQADDVNKDGNIEIVVGSEDHILYVLQMVNQQQIAEEMEGCWQALQYNAGDQQGLLYELAYSSISSLRCFALMRIASQPAYREKDLEILQELVVDPSNDVRFTFAQEIAQIHHASPSHSRPFLDLLLADQERDVRLALVDSLMALTRIDSHIGFQYLERLTRSVDSWVRRAVVRKLYQLVDAFPRRVFHLLLSLVCDETEWVRQEAARALAHYFDLHEETVIEESRFLITHNVDFPLLLLIAHCATRPIVQSIFLVAYGLLVDLNETNVQERLEKALMVFRKTRKLKHGEVTWQVYRELHRLHRMRNIDEISSYTCTVCQEDLSGITQFEGIVQTFRQLAGIAAILGTYLKRDGLGDRLASLLEASSALESIRLNLEREPLAEKGRKPKLPDHLLVELLLTRWRDIVVIELKGLRGKANLKPELRTKSAHSEQHVGIWLEIRNEGRSPADNLKVMLKESSDFDIISEPIRELEIVPALGTVIAEFTIHPKTPFPHLAFEIVYDDAEFKEKLLLFGDKLQIRENDREFKRIVNPYTVGVPIQKPEMFYGREKDLEMLQEDLTSTLANMVVVLCGQRRSGKSSLLYQLRNSGCLSPHICIYIDMQHETYGLSTSKLFYHLAFAIHRDLKAVGLPTDLPPAEDFAHDPTFAFDQFLDDAEEARGQRKLIIMIDEFEILELKVSEKILDWEIFEFLRSLMQHRRGINFLFSGTHSIEQLTQGYWSVFFNIARHHRLSKLHENASRQLITQPVKGYIEYDPLAIEKIRLLAADQPYLIQLFCRSLVTHCNRSRKSYITINDVNTVQDEVMETGQIHFKWLWEQATLEERLVLSIVAQEGREEGRALSLKKIKEVYQIHGLLYHHETILHAIESLIEADIVERVAEGTHFRVPIGLIRKWLLEVKPLRRVLQEENFPTR